jgi:hypothetical protein
MLTFFEGLAIGACAFSGGYLWCAVFAVGPLNMRLRSKCSDLQDAVDSIASRDAAIAAHMAHIGDQRRMILTKEQIIDDLEAQADRLGDLVDKWVPARKRDGRFVKKVA